MKILSIFNNLKKKYFFVDKNVYTASNGIISGVFKKLYMYVISPVLNMAELIFISTVKYVV